MRVTESAIVCSARPADPGRTPRGDCTAQGQVLDAGDATRATHGREVERRDPPRRRAQTLRDEAEGVREMVGAGPDRAHRAACAKRSRPEMRCAEFTVEERDEAIRIRKQASAFTAAAGWIGVPEDPFRVSRWEDGAIRVATRPLESAWARRRERTAVATIIDPSRTERTQRRALTHANRAAQTANRHTRSGTTRATENANVGRGSPTSPTHHVFRRFS